MNSRPGHMHSALGLLVLTDLENLIVDRSARRNAQKMCSLGAEEITFRVRGMSVYLAEQK